MKIKINQPYSFYQLGRRDNQEDARFPDSDKPENPLPFFVVCDGVGGLDKGEVASRTVCESFEETLSEFDWSEKLEVSDFENALGKAYEALSDVVNSSTKDMATTMTFVGFHRGGATMAHIGDSRIYHIRPEVGIMYRSDDHSLVNALVRSGNITAEQAINHPQSNFITRSMSCVDAGDDYSAATLVETTDINAGDYFFLCTDGVLDRVSDEKLLMILEKQVSDAEKCGELARLSADSSDNNTAMLIGVSSVESEPEDEIQEDENSKKEESSETTALHRRTDVAIEVTIKNKNTIGKTISKFFKKLF